MISGADLLPARNKKDDTGKISVLIPTYNRSGKLFEAVDSVLAQTVLPHEIIIIDDGSSHMHAARNREITALNKIIKFHRLDKNRERSVARNTALDLAQGEIIHFLDDDDIIHPKFYEVGLQKLAETHADFVVCRASFFSDPSPCLDNEKQVLLTLHSKLLESNPIFFCALKALRSTLYHAASLL